MIAVHECMQILVTGSMASIKMNNTQRHNIEHLVAERPIALITVLKNKCAVCRQDWRGRVNPDWGVYAHPDCIKESLIDVWPDRRNLPLPFLKTLPHKQSLATTGSWRRAGTFKLWNRSDSPCIPVSMTYEGNKAEIAEAKMMQDAEEAQSRSEDIQRRKIQHDAEKARRDSALTAWRGEFLQAARSLHLGKSSRSSAVSIINSIPTALRSFVRNKPALQAAAFAHVILTHHGNLPSELWPICFGGRDSETSEQVSSIVASSCNEIPQPLWKFAYGRVHDFQYTQEILELIKIHHTLIPTKLWSLAFNYPQKVARVLHDMAHGVLAMKQIQYEDGQHEHFCACGSKSAMACPNEQCGKCCAGCPRHPRRYVDD
jgi:hypothetical protein